MKFKRIADDVAVVFETGLVVEANGPDFETGGTRAFVVYFDPHVNKDNIWREEKIDFSKVPTTNPLILESLPEATRVMFRSPEREKIGTVYFVPTVSEEKIEWISELAPEAETAIAKKFNTGRAKNFQFIDAFVECLAETFDWSSLRRNSSIRYSVYGLAPLARSEAPTDRKRKLILEG